MEKQRDQKIDYIELSVKDIARTRSFYDQAFGWSFKEYGPAYCEFTDGNMTGGFALGGEGNPGGPIKSGGGPLVLLYANNLEDSQRRVENAGGRIVVPIFSFPGGRRFHFADPDGYVLGVWSEG